MLELYENIKRLRKQNKWSQTELAKRAGYTDRSSIAKIEKGEVDLPQSKILTFAKVFGVAPGELMGWDLNTSDIIFERINKEASQHRLDQYAKILSQIANLDDSKLELASKLVETLDDKQKE